MQKMIAKAILLGAILLSSAFAVGANDINYPSEAEVQAVCNAAADGNAEFINIPYNAKTQWDINNDGESESVLIITEGSGGYESVFYFAADGREIKPTPAYDTDAGKCCIRNIEGIEFAGRQWIIKGEKNRPEQTLFIAADNRKHLACEFDNQIIKRYAIPNNFSVRPKYQ